jgi:hypothetical protein
MPGWRRKVLSGVMIISDDFSVSDKRQKRGGFGAMARSHSRAPTDGHALLKSKTTQNRVCF